MLLMVRRIRMVNKEFAYFGTKIERRSSFNFCSKVSKGSNVFNALLNTVFDVGIVKLTAPFAQVVRSNRRAMLCNFFTEKKPHTGVPVCEDWG